MRWPSSRKQLLQRCADEGLEVSYSPSGHTRISKPGTRIYVSCSTTPKNHGDAAKQAARDVKKYLGVDLRR